ncbi:hypothetical protein Bca4012_100028 [Brassica carinata]
MERGLIAGAGLIASKPERAYKSVRPALLRTAESAGKQSVMQSATCLVEAIILEWKDRDRSGSTIDPVICCIWKLVHS